MEGMWRWMVLLACEFGWPQGRTRKFMCVLGIITLRRSHDYHGGLLKGFIEWIIFCKAFFWARAWCWVIVFGMLSRSWSYWVPRMELLCLIVLSHTRTSLNGIIHIFLKCRSMMCDRMTWWSNTVGHWRIGCCMNCVIYRIVRSNAVSVSPCESPQSWASFYDLRCWLYATLTIFTKVYTANCSERMKLRSWCILLAKFPGWMR